MRPQSTERNRKTNNHDVSVASAAPCPDSAGISKKFNKRLTRAPTSAVKSERHVERRSAYTLPRKEHNTEKKEASESTGINGAAPENEEENKNETTLPPKVISKPVRANTVGRNQP